MYKVEVQLSRELGEQTYKTILKNGLEVYICTKPGFTKKIGMFGTKYGSIDNEFLDIITNKKIKVPDGIAHFLEHKLFEKEGANALDLFAKMGVRANAYTSFDQTVYYFETCQKFKECIGKLVSLIKEPYFTDENVKKEQGIIGQEIKMYEDEPSYRAYFNTLIAMYNTNPVKIDIAGTVESISHITKELLYTCYNTFYSPQNMFFLVVGDVDVQDTINIIESNMRKYEKNYDNKKNLRPIEKYTLEEQKQTNKREIVDEMDVMLPELSIGYKLKIKSPENIIKMQIIASMISDIFFSKSSEFYEKEYSNGNLVSEIEFQYEGSKSFSHVIIAANTKNIEKLKKSIIDYIEKIKTEEIDNEKFELIKRKEIGEIISLADNLSVSYRRIIDSIIIGSDIYADINFIEDIKIEDIKNFLELLKEENRVFSIIVPKKDS
ncbi:MAG: pitrilysin family protein [Clostridia bacterium]